MSVSKINYNDQNEAYLVVDPISDINKEDFKKYLDIDCPSFLKCEFEKNKAFYLYYSYGDRITLKQFLSQVIEKNEALDFLKSLTKVYMDAEKYGLNTDRILLGINSMFYDVEQKQVSCIYVPVNDGILPARPLRLFIKELLVNMLYNENDEMTWLGNIIRYISNHRQLVYGNFYDFLQSQEETGNTFVSNVLESIPNAESVDALKIDIEEESEPTETKIESVPEVIIEETGAETESEEDSDMDEIARKIAEKFNEEDENSDDGSSEDMETETVEETEDREHCFLYRRKDQSVYELDQNVIRIGKASDNEIPVYDNPAVSRVHAIIRRYEGGYVICDNGSTNHTFVNGVVLVGEQNKKLSAGDRILLGNEEFVFKVQ